MNHLIYILTTCQQFMHVSNWWLPKVSSWRKPLIVVNELEVGLVIVADLGGGP